MNDLTHWKRTMLTLPDDTFFNIMRNYLGEISTPFNKHTLIDNLVHFLRRKSVQSRMNAFLNKKDKLVLSGIRALEHPTLEMLQLLLSPEFGYMDLNEKLLNLESRLLIYQYAEDDCPAGEGRCISLNPALPKHLIEKASRPGNLISVGGGGAGKPGIPWMNDSLMLAFLSYLLEKPLLFKADGGWKVKAEEEIYSRFPGLMDESSRRLDLLRLALLRTGLASEQELRLAPCLEAWKSISSMDKSTRLLSLWSAASAYSWETQDVPDNALSRNREMITLFGSFLASIPRGCTLTGEVLRRIFLIQASRRAVSFPGKEELDNSLDTLRFLDLLSSAETIHQQVDADAVHVVVQPNFELSVPPELDLDRGLIIALSSRIKHFDQLPCFEITRGSFHRFLNHGYSSTELIEHLQKLSARSVPQNILFSLQTWEREFRKLQIYDGVVLIADEDRQYLLEHSRLLKKYIHRKLGKGIYLLDRGEKEAWMKALFRAGLEFVPDVKSADQEKRSATVGGLFPAGEPIPVNRLELPQRQEESASEHEGPDDSEAELALENELEKAFRKREQELSPAQIEEIRSRLKERLILVPEQLRPLRVKVEKMEATGLDFLGKVRLIEQAINRGSLLELIERTAGGSPRRMNLRPERLERKASELILVGESLPEKRGVRVRVSKINLIRKLRRSLY